MKYRALLASLFLCWVQVSWAQAQIYDIDTINITKNNLTNGIKVSKSLNIKSLEKSAGNNLAHILRELSGVTILQSGNNISKPVIQGLTNQRIAILNNGVKIESQQWGYDHAPEIDPFLAQNIEVTKGAEAIKYSSNALGGVIQIKTPILPYFQNKIGGRAQFLGASNSEKWASNLMLQGNIGVDKSFAWRFQGSTKKFGNYYTPDYFVDNTGGREQNFSANIGYQMANEKVETFYSFFSTTLGIYRGSRIGSPSDWDLRLQIGSPLDKGRFSYEILNPRQVVKHHLVKISIESKRDFGDFYLNYNFQKNIRQEYDLRRGKLQYKPSLDVELNTHSLNLEYQKEHHLNFKNFSGIHLSFHENYNIPGTGINSILPNYTAKNYGAYISEEYKKGAWVLYAGLRFDYKTFDAEGYNRIGQYYSGSKSFKNWSHTLGLNKSFGKNWSLTSNIGMAWRAPEAIELFSNGIHHGSAFYLQGDEALKIERSLKWSNSIRFSGAKIKASADIFVQKIHGFIYERPTKTYINTWGGYFPLFQYQQSDALFKGVDLDFKYRLFPNLDYENRVSLIHADNLSESYYFPYISPEQVIHGLNLKLENITRLSGSYIELKHQWQNKQTRFSPEVDLLPDAPEAFHLFHLSLGTDVGILKKNDMNISLSVDNLLNTRYKDYTDRFRYFAHGMGRNIQFRVNYNF